MTTAHVEAVVYGALALVGLALSVNGFVRARRGGDKKKWRYVGLFGFVLCAFIVVLNLNGVVLHGPGSGHHSSSRLVGG